MKYIITLILICFIIPVIGQVRPISIGDKKVPTKVLGKLILDSLFIPPSDTASISASERGFAIMDQPYWFNGTNWVAFGNNSGGSGSGSTDTLFNGGQITSLPDLTFNPSTKNISKWIDTVFYRSQGPTTTLTGGIALEYRSTQNLTYTISYTSGRQTGTKPLQSITVAGINKAFFQPAPGASVSGTQSVTFPANTDITYTNFTTTTDGKSNSATTSFQFLPMRYFGWITDTTGISNGGYDNSKITALSNELTNSKSKTWNTGNPTGTQFYVYAYYYTAGNLSNLTLNGFPSLSAFNVVQRSFTNALGFTDQWIIYWSKNGQTLSSDIIAN